jgi:uncharacterized protein YcfL
MKRLLAASALIGLALLATGCATSVNTATRAESQASPAYVNDQRVITDQSLARKLTIVSINEGKASGNLLRIQATLRNNSSKPQTYLYKFDWISDEGMDLSSPTGGWQTLRFEGKEERSISAIATNPRAVDFRLKLRE